MVLDDVSPAHMSQTLPRRSRPSEIPSIGDDVKTLSLRTSKLGRRESRIGFRNLFTRSGKSPKDESTPTSPTSPTSPQSPSYASLSSSVRNSLAEMAHWPYGQQTHSEVTLPGSEPLETTLEEAEAEQQLSPSAGGKRKPLSSTPGKTRQTPANCAFPSLAKAYLQAVKYGTLPAVSISADTILRLSEKRVNAGADPSTSVLELGDESKTSDMEKLKRRLRGDALLIGNVQWTTKTFVLLNSGCLMQYAGEGNFERAPEKVLRLGSSSAAFATDVIPGRHWVLQVSSSTDGEAVPQSPESRSIFSKLTFRAPQEKRNASNLLMVFESAEDMRDWMTVLRTEIEKLGGKKKVMKGVVSDESELRHDGDIPLVNTASSSAYDTLWEHPEEPRISDCSRASGFDASAQDGSIDDDSTNSVVSHDGRQLDSLRENANRLSVLSSGQRTVMTSTCSTPAGSPVLERFPRHMEVPPLPQDAKSLVEARLRPNANVILDHRKSLQNSALFVTENDSATIVHARPATSGVTTPLTLSPVSSPRSSYVKLSPVEGDAPMSQIKDPHSIFPRPSLRKQLATIRTGRPLSTVQDQPSPKERVPERPITSHHAPSRPTSPQIRVPKFPRSRLMSIQHIASHDDLARHSSITDAMSAPRPRRLSSLSALRKHDDEVSGASNSEPILTRLPATQKLYSALPPPVVPWSESSRRRRASMDPTDAGRGLFAPTSRAAKRASVGSTYSNRSSIAEIPEINLMELPPMPAPPPSTPLPPIPQRPLTATGKRSLKSLMPPNVLVNKTSMPQLVVEGPPAVPPPTCALPPIPLKPTVPAKA